MQKFKVGQKVRRIDTPHIEECEIIEYIPKYLDSVKGNPFLVHTDAYKVKYDDGNTAIVPERCLSEIKCGVRIVKVEQIIQTTKMQELEIVGATLLSVEEAENLPFRLRKYDRTWWLRSPGLLHQIYAGHVLGGGAVSYLGKCVDEDDRVRPVLKIQNLQSSNLEIGDRFIFNGKRFEIISDKLAFCLEDIGMHCFRKDFEAEDANVYEKSDVKKFIDEWFEKHRQKCEGVNYE